MKIIKTLKFIILLIICAILGFVVAAFIDLNNDSQNDDENNDKVVDVINIETPYVNVEFPKEMQDEVTIKTESEDAYTMQFYGTIKDKEELLMEITFGSEKGVLVGYYSTEDANIPVSVVYYEPENLDSDEMIYVQEVHMASEYVIDNLCKDEKFRLVK